LLHLLVLALVAQAAAAHGAMPCAAGNPAADSEVSERITAAPAHMQMDHSDHQMHAAHHAAHHAAQKDPAATPDGMADHTDMPCCNNDGIAVCSVGHCVTTTPVLPMPGLALRPQTARFSNGATLDWLPPYGNPLVSIFRPPIS
jgi:hypothetical protein